MNVLRKTKTVLPEKNITAICLARKVYSWTQRPCISPLHLQIFPSIVLCTLEE